MSLKLYFNPYSRASRVRWLLEELGATYELAHLDFEKDEGWDAVAKVHPLGMLPAMEVDGKPLFESAALLLHLADRFPEKGLAPAVGTYERGLYYQWLLFAMTELEPPCVEYYIQTEMAEGDEKIAKNLEWAKSAWKEKCTALAQHVKGKDYLVGGKMTAADVCTASILAWGGMMGLLEGFDDLKRYSKNLGARPAAKKAREGAE